MFLHREHDPAGPFVISQVSHAWMAWQLASHWGNRRFPRPAPKAEVSAAVLLHDSGWTEFDAEPTVDGDGRPRTFDRMVPELHLDIWRGSINRTSQHSRYAGLLVAAHFRSLAERKVEDLLRRDDTAQARTVQRFLAEMERLEASWEEQLDVDPRYQRALRGAGRVTNARLISACDTIAVVLCASMGLPVTATVSGRDDQPVEVRLSDAGDGRCRLDPWPLEGDALTLHCEARRLRSNRFRHPAALREALQTAPVERLTFILERPSQSGG